MLGTRGAKFGKGSELCERFCAEDDGWVRDDGSLGLSPSCAPLSVVPSDSVSPSQATIAPTGLVASSFPCHGSAPGAPHPCTTEPPKAPCEWPAMPSRARSIT